MPDTYSPTSPNLDIKRRQLQYRQGPEQLGAIQPLPTRKQSTSEPQLSFRGRCIRNLVRRNSCANGRPAWPSEHWRTWITLCLLSGP